MDEITVLFAVINSDLIGGYFLEICTEDMKVLFTCKDVKSYADYVRINRKFIDGTLWTAKENVSEDLAFKVYNEALQHNDIFLLVDTHTV